MNEASQQRIEWAKTVAAIYSRHPDVRAIILGGSAARGHASEESDIDLGIFWSQLGSERERNFLIRQFGGNLTRSVDNYHRFRSGNPRREGCIEIIDFSPPAATLQVRLDLEHGKVTGTEQVLRQVLDDGDLSLEKQELISVIQKGIPIYGHEIVNRWREISNRYPDELAHKMVAENITGIGDLLLTQLGWINTQDWFCLHEGFLDIGRCLLLSLMGLNRVWAFTDNPDFKGLKPSIEMLELKPPNFINRLGQALQTDASTAILRFATLSDDVLDLIETHLPAEDTLSERQVLKQVIQRTSP